MECCVCFHDFNTTNNRPKGLPCLHSLCPQCVVQLYENKTLKCPTCQVVHKAESPQVFKDHFALCQVLEHFEQFHLVPKQGTHSSTGTEQPWVKGRDGSKTSSSAFVTDRLAQASTSYGAVKTTVDKMVVFCGKIIEMEQMSHETVNKVTPIIDLINKVNDEFNVEKTKAKQVHDKGQQLLVRLQEAMGSLKNASGNREVLESLDCLDEAQEAAQVWSQETQQGVANIDLLHQWAKIHGCFKLFNRVLRNIGIQDIELPEVPGEKEEEDESGAEVEGACGGDLTVEQLLQGRQLGQLWTAGMYAVHYGDSWRSGRVSLHRNHLCVHHLDDGPAPAHTNTIQLTDLLGTIDTSNRLVFLDLSWPESAPRRVSIKLSPDTAAAQWFLDTIVGQRWQGWKDKYFTWVQNKGQPLEWLVGPVGVAGMERLVNGQQEYKRPWVAGAVWWDHIYNNQFYIMTSDSPGCTAENVFGEVVSGLEVVQEAARVHDVKQVKIHDCGVMLPR